ncbi:hypothetical protein NMG60_11012796 [Bertholletia excelsa]
MASSNRHWPSMFKSKPCNHHHHHQWQHDINPPLMSSACHRPPFTSGCEERSPEPKPRWNPKPEQIRILEAIFNSGMVNPPRDEIRKIRAQLQEYGQVGDANVFYWFQNRKSRSKHKQRHLQTTKQQNNNSSSKSPVAAPAPSSSSSSGKSSPKSADKGLSVGLNSPTPSVNQPPYFPAGEFLPEPFLFPVQPNQGFYFPELGLFTGDQTAGSCSGVLLNELMMKKGEDDEKVTVNEQLSYTIAATAPVTATHSVGVPSITSTAIAVPSTVSHILGTGAADSGAVGPGHLSARITVFINDVAFEVASGPFNVREAFGDDAVLIHSSSHPVVTNEWGVTLQSLQHGGSYYLLRTLTPVTASETQLIWYLLYLGFPVMQAI